METQRKSKTRIRSLTRNYSSGGCFSDSHTLEYRHQRTETTASSRKRRMSLGVLYTMTWGRAEMPNPFCCYTLFIPRPPLRDYCITPAANSRTCHPELNL